MNDKISRTETRRNNRNKIIEKIFSQSQRATFNSVNYKIQVQNMLQQIKQFEVMKNRCSSEYDQKYTWILKLSPQPRRKICIPIHKRIEITSNKQQKIINKQRQDEDKTFKQQFSLNSNTRYTQNPNRFDSRNAFLISPNQIKDTVSFKKQRTMEGSSHNFDYKNICKFSSWSRKSSKSLL